jgi:hypothetical protein
MEGLQRTLRYIRTLEAALSSRRGQAELLSLVFSLNKEIGLLARTEPSLASGARAIQGFVNSATVAIKRGDIDSALTYLREAEALAWRNTPARRQDTSQQVHDQRPGQPF